nr:efflux RND transporter periplasmic adaptor subunit [Desulfobacteraceae bacterium]
QSLSHTQELFDLKLATNTQLLQAKQASQQARLQLENLKRQGIDGQRTLQANAAGLVSKVSAQEGAIVAAGNPLMDIVAQDRLEVRLNVEPQDAGRLQPGQPVALTYVDIPASKGVVGKVRRISRAVNPATRLVDVFVTLPETSGFLLGEYIQGRITAASSEGFVVPREAVLPEGGHHVLFTVSRKHAVRHVVQIGLENDRETEVTGPELRPGEPVVVLGNYELRDGMAVEVENSK